MRKYYFIYVLIFSLYAAFTSGQITYLSIPMDSQLVARNLQTNLGTFNIQGKVDSLSIYDSICLKIYRDSNRVDSIYQSLHYYGDSAPFNFSFEVPAELHEYSVSVYGIKNGIQTLDTTVVGLLAGDVYVIEGQSNAFAMERDGQNADTNKSEFIRVFGNSNPDTAALLANLRWFRGEGNGDYMENGHTGQWGLRLGRLLVDSIKIPIAIFNGAYGGTPISYYERPANYKTNLNSNYGRLYYRLTLTNLQNDIRAIIWSQGETDGNNGTSTTNYKNEFDTLYTSWQQDYCGFEKTYIFQTKTETVYSILGIMQIEEAQREVALANNKDIEIMSTAALKQDKGSLHFDYTGGYKEFGNRIYELIARDIYGIYTKREIDAPMIQDAFLSDSTTLIIRENAGLLLQHNPAISLQTKPTKCYQLENTTPNVVIDTIFPDKNEIVLKLSQYPGINAKVSYLAPLNDTGTNWLTNTNGLDMVCFYQYPIADSIKRFAGIPGQAVLGEVKIYPNPCKNYTTILLPGPKKYLIELCDTNGHTIKKIIYEGESYMLSTGGLSKGIYLTRVFDTHYNLINSTRLEVQ